MNWCRSFGFVALSMLLAANAFADAPNGDAAPEKYDGGTFSLIPPKGWLIVSGNLSEKEVQKLPENVREHYTLRNTDVIYMNLDAPDADTKGFKDSLNIVTINEPIPLSDELVKELTTVLTQQYETMFENFEFESAKQIKLGEIDVLQVKGGYKVLNYDVRMEQYLVPSSKESVVLTCTYDSSKDKAAEIIKACTDSVHSLVISK